MYSNECDIREKNRMEDFIGILEIRLAAEHILCIKRESHYTESVKAGSNILQPRLDEDLDEITRNSSERYILKVIKKKSHGLCQVLHLLPAFCILCIMSPNLYKL